LFKSLRRKKMLVLVMIEKRSGDVKRMGPNGFAACVRGRYASSIARSERRSIIDRCIDRGIDRAGDRNNPERSIRKFFCRPKRIDRLSHAML